MNVHMDGSDPETGLVQQDGGQFDREAQDNVLESWRDRDREGDAIICFIHVSE